MKPKLSEYEILIYEAELVNFDLWNCLFEITGENDGSLTLDSFDDSQNEISKKNYKGWKFYGSLN